jgi:YbbR domain-containing protein
MPETVTIMGAKEALEGIDLVKAEDVDISGITSTSKIGLSIKLPEDVYLSQKSQEVSVYVVINNVAVSEVSVPAANVQLLGIAEGCTAYIDENVGSIKLVVRGAESLVQSAAASDFVISTDLTGMEQGTHEVTLNLEYIKGFSSVEMEPVRVHVTIKNEAQ